jgi:hypothetical protein
MADPSTGNSLTMMTTCTTAATRISITLPAAAMTKGKALAAMTMIQLYEEQREAIAFAETHHRTSRAKDVIPHHPHQVAPMSASVAVAAQPGHVTPEKISRITSPTTLYPPK